jgi:hypothetical protein
MRRADQAKHDGRIAVQLDIVNLNPARRSVRNPASRLPTSQAVVSGWRYPAE